jgi:gamma-glutamyltranspeptidase/glutathione hydrolase
VNTPKDAADGRRSSDSWGNLQTVEWNRRDNTLHGGSDPRNPVGKALVLPEASLQDAGTPPSRP